MRTEPRAMNDGPSTGPVAWRLRNDDTGEVYPLGPMYRGTLEYATRKLQAEKLPYAWTLIPPEADDE